MIMKTAMVAGGAGFIGSHLCSSLLTEDFLVFCIDNFITGDKENIKDLLKNPNFKLIEHDITGQNSKLIHSTSSGQISKIDYIFHLASPASPNKKSPKSYINFPIETLLANSTGTHNLLELTKDLSAKFLYASSSEVYGDSLVSPQKEDYFGNVNPNGVRSVYDEGKRFGEAMTMTYFRKYKENIRIVRIFNTYGPKMRADDGRVVSNFINQAISNSPLTVYGDGSQTRSLCFIDDMIDGLKKAMFLETSGEVINLGNPKEQTILELASLIKEMTNSKSEIVFEELPQDDPKKRRPDISKAKRILNWTPKVDVNAGLKKTIEYFKSIKLS